MGKPSPDQSQDTSSQEFESAASSSDFQHEDGELSALHSELRDNLVRIGWAICRDWSLAEDATQEAFALLQSKLNEVPPNHRKGWLVRTVQLTAKNLERKERRQSGAELIPGIAGREEEIREEGFGLEAEETREQLASLMQTLPHEQLEVLRMRFERQLSFNEIAKELEIPLGTALSRLRLAIGRLRKQITDG